MPKEFGGKIVVAALTNEADAARVAAVGARLAKSEKARLHLVFPYAVPLAQPLQGDHPEARAAADAIFQRGAAAAVAAGVTPTTEVVVDRASAQAIVRAAKTMVADYVVLGVGDRPAAGDSPLDATLQAVLRGVSCEVVLVRGARLGPRPA